MGDIIDNITLSNAKTISVPVIREACINMECTLQDIMMLVPAKEKDGDVRISVNLLRCTDAVAHCCKECGKIIVDYSAKEA